jgi:UDP-N-acetyl-D-galactosamine dehydrogenase
MGVTFKENCPDIRNSKAIDIVKELEDHGAEVLVTDPKADAGEVKHEYGITLGEISEQSPVDALVVAVGHEEYRRMTPDHLRSLVKGDKPFLVDVKSLFNRNACIEAGFKVFRL